MTSIVGEPGPPRLSGKHRIGMWAPGTEVRFEKPLSFAFFVYGPLTLAVLAGPVMWVAMGRRQLTEPDLTGQVVLSAIVGIVGLWLGLSNLLGALLALPERVTFDWASGRLRISGRRRRREIPLAAITEIEVRGVWEARVSRQNDMSRDVTYRYKCQLWAHYRWPPTSPTRTIELIETKFINEDPIYPMFETSTVAAELAAALGVKHRVTDFPPIRPE